MSVNKPQLALAWIGEETLLAEAWAQMKKTPSLGELPIEVMPRPQSVSVETETWRYRFYHCPTAEELAYMRVSTNRPAGVLWCLRLEGAPLAEVYSEPLFFAGSLGLPVVVFLFLAERGTTEAEEGERQTRELLSGLGFSADDALIVYGLSTPQATQTQWSEAITGLYQALDASLLIPGEQKLPPRALLCQRAEVVLFLPNESAKTPLKEGMTIELLTGPQKAIRARILAFTRLQSVPRGASATVSIEFWGNQALLVEGSFLFATEETFDKPATGRWLQPNPERYIGHGFAIRDLP